VGRVLKAHRFALVGLENSAHATDAGTEQED